MFFKIVLLKVLQISLKNTCVGVSFSGLQLHQKENPTQIISIENWKVLKSTFFTEELWWLLLYSDFSLPLWTNNNKSYVRLRKWCSSWQRKLSLNKFISSYVKVFEKLQFNKINDYLAACLSDVITDFWENRFAKQCMKGVQMQCFSSPYFSVFELNTKRYSVSLRIQSKYEKIRTRRNSVFGHFSRSEHFLIKISEM